MDDGEVYEIWISRIAKRFEKGEWEGEKGLREHIIHHSLELENHEDIPLEWLASMTTLMDMAKRLSKHDIEVRIGVLEEEGRKHSVGELKNIIIEHVVRLRRNEISFEWIVMMVAFLGIVGSITSGSVTKRLQIERLYLHWKNDMAHMEPPPFETLLLEKKVEDENVKKENRVYQNNNPWIDWTPGDS